MIDVVKKIRKELLIKDEPLKAYHLLKELDMPELKEELDDTYEMIKHAFEPDVYEDKYDVLADDSEVIEPPYYAEHAGKRYTRYAWVLQEIEELEPESLIDFGCYVGSVVTTAAKRFGVKGIGVDLTKTVIERAKRRAKDLGVDDITEFYQGDVTEWDKERADLVISHEVIEHVADPKEYIKHMADLADKWCYVTTPNGPYGDGEGNQDCWSVAEFRGHLRVFTKNSMQDMLEDAGMEIEHLEGHDDGLLWVKFRKEQDE